MTINDYVVKRPVTMAVLFSLLCLTAAFLVPQLAVNMFPDSSPPVISVSTAYPGAGPEDVEENLTEPLEEALSAVTGLASISSTSSFESSRLMLEFGFEIDIEEAQGDVDSILSRMTDSLPEDAETPTSFQFDMSSAPIMRLGLSGPYSLSELKSRAEETLQSRLERIPGVASTEISGGRARELKVAVSPNRMAAYGLSLSEISAALSAQNVLSGGGTLTEEKQDRQIMTNEVLQSPEDAGRIVLQSFKNGRAAIRLADVAAISLTEEEADTQVYVNGEPAVYIQVQKDSDGNSVQVSQAVRDALPAMKEELPADLSLSVLSDTTTMIRATMTQVYQSALQGALLAMLVIFLFLRNIKGTIIIGLSIPISILVTLMFMALFELTLNLLTLTGLIMGLGMIVDGSIVILENIHTYRKRGTGPSTAAILGSREMFRAITASTATTLSVFIPVLLFKHELEMMGDMFSELVFTVVISLLVSLAVAVLLIPPLAGPLLRLHTRRQKPLKSPILRGPDRLLDNFFTKLTSLYTTGLKYCLSHRALVLLLILTLLTLSLVQFPSLGMNLFPRGSSDDTVEISLSMPSGTTRAETREHLQGLQREVEEQVKGWESLVMTVGSGGGRWGSSSGNKGSLQINLPPPAEQEETPADIRALITPYLSRFAEGELELNAGRRMGSTDPIDIEIMGLEQEKALAAAEEIKTLLQEALPEIRDPAISTEEGNPQIEVDIQRERAALLDLSVPKAAAEIRTAFNGSRASQLKKNGQSVDIVVELAGSENLSSEDLASLPLKTAGGHTMPLINIASLRHSTAPAEITREDQKRVIHVTGGLDNTRAASQIQEKVEALIESSISLPEGVTVAYGGEAAEVNRFSGSFLLVIAAAILLVFGVMASQFESFVDPFIIFFSIPLLAIGVITIYQVTGEPFSLFSAVGVVALIGIVVNNGIVLVDYTNILLARGFTVREACLEAGRSRLQPILMTTLTTILGMAPLAFFPGEGAETIQPIAKTIVGGLSVSSLMTLFVTPVIYSLLNHMKRKETE